MDLLKDLVKSAKTKELDAKRKLDGGEQTGTTKKYVRQGDLERLREEQYRQEQEAIELARTEKARQLQEQQQQQQIKKNAKKKTEATVSGKNNGLLTGKSDIAQTARESTSAMGTSTAENTEVVAVADREADTEMDEAVFNIPAEETTKQLRNKGHPIRLFGETDRDRIIRLRLIESESDESRGRGNEYRGQQARTEAGLQLEILQGAASTDERKKRRKDLASVLFRPEYDASLISPKLFRSDPDRCYILIYVYIRQLLEVWENELNDRVDGEKRSTAGKLEYTKFVQTKDNLRPFFKLLKKKKVEQDVMEKIAEILDHVQNREYVRANDSYLRLSIGNAPWPIGVTMVGIHERSAREKIFSNQVAHVLNDETQRKWIQSIKRLMTFAQHKYPPADLTKCVG